jgi:hypothetical protein
MTGWGPDHPDTPPVASARGARFLRSAVSWLDAGIEEAIQASALAPVTAG